MYTLKLYCLLKQTVSSTLCNASPHEFLFHCIDMALSPSFLSDNLNKLIFVKPAIWPSPKWLNIGFAFNYSEGCTVPLSWYNKRICILLWPRIYCKNIQLYHEYCQYVYIYVYYVYNNISYHISSYARRTQRPGTHLRILRSRLIIHQGPWQNSPVEPTDSGILENQVTRYQPTWKKCENSSWWFQAFWKI